MFSIKSLTITIMNKSILLYSIYFLSTAAFAVDCVSPESPAIPNGRTAKRDDMVNAMKLVNAYIDDSAKYRDCIEAFYADKKEDPEQYEVLMSTLQDSIDTTYLVSDMFNTQLRLFKTANPE